MYNFCITLAPAQQQQQLVVVGIFQLLHGGFKKTMKHFA
jgi:hypothetical protein